MGKVFQLVILQPLYSIVLGVVNNDCQSSLEGVESLKVSTL